MLRKCILLLGIFFSAYLILAEYQGYSAKAQRAARRDTPEERQAELLRFPKDIALRRQVLLDFLEDSRYEDALQEYQDILRMQGSYQTELVPLVFAFLDQGIPLEKLLPAQLPALHEWLMQLGRFPGLPEPYQAQSLLFEKNFQTKLNEIFIQAVKNSKNQEDFDPMSILDFCLSPWMKGSWQLCLPQLDFSQGKIPGRLFSETKEADFLPGHRLSDRRPEKGSLSGFGSLGLMRFSEGHVSLGFVLSKWDQEHDLLLVLPLLHGPADRFAEVPLRVFFSPDNKKFQEVPSQALRLEPELSRTLFVLEIPYKPGQHFGKIFFPKLPASFGTSPYFPLRIFLKPSRKTSKEESGKES